MSAAKPSLALVPSLLPGLVAWFGHYDAADAKGLSVFDTARRVVAAVRSRKMWWFSEDGDVTLDGGRERWRVSLPADDLDVRDDPAFGFLHFDELAKFGRAVRLSSSQNLRGWLEHADQLAAAPRIAAEYAIPRLSDHALAQLDKLLELRNLTQDRASLRPPASLDLISCGCHRCPGLLQRFARDGQKPTVGSFERFGVLLCQPLVLGDLPHPARQRGPDAGSDKRECHARLLELTHTAPGDSHCVLTQTTIGRRTNRGLDNRRVDTHATSSCDLSLDRE